MSIVEFSGFTMQLRGENMARTVLDDISITVEPGQILGIVGESGSGKTLLTRAMLGSFPAGSQVSGSVRVANIELVGSTKAERRHVRQQVAGIVFQDPRASVNPLHPIEDFLCEAVVRSRQLTRAQARERALELLTVMRLENPARTLRAYPDQLSGGMLQRVVIAAAMMTRPQVLICDEATTALDVTTQAEIVQLLTRLSEDTGVAVVFVTHDLDLAGELCDRLCVLYAGQAQEVGPTRKVLADPLHPYTLALLAAIPRVTDAEGHRLPAIPGGVLPLTASGAGCRFSDRCARYRQELCDLPSIPVVTVDDRDVRCTQVSYDRN